LAQIVSGEPLCNNNGPSDEIPLTNSHWNHWLNVENVLVSGKGADRVIEVVLEGNADQRGDRVLCLLDQVVRIIGGALLRLLRQKRTASSPNRASADCILVSPVSWHSPLCRAFHPHLVGQRAGIVYSTLGALQLKVHPMEIVRRLLRRLFTPSVGKRLFKPNVPTLPVG
jgi:hypothetical protein